MLLAIHVALNYNVHELNLACLAEIGSGKMADKINELRDWLGPLKTVSKVDTSELSELIKQLKAYAEDILEMPKGLVTVLRMLRQLAIPPQENTIDGQSNSVLHASFFSLYICGFKQPFVQNIS